MNSSSEGEAAVAAMVQAARRTFEAVRLGDDATRTERVQALHAEYEQHWAHVRQAAAALDTRLSQGGSVPAAQADADPSEVAALLQERLQSSAQTAAALEACPSAP